MTLMSVAKFERFYRQAAGVDVDKEDLRRHSDFVGRKLRDLVIVGQAVAGANGRDVTEPFDLPLTKGLQETIHRFRSLDADIELRPVLEQLAVLPPLDRPLSDGSIGRMPEIAGGLSLALARTFVLLDPRLANPQSRHWEQAFRTFDLLL